MSFIPLELMLSRVSRFGGDSDASLFSELLYAGEFVVKVTTAALVAAIEDDHENHRYRLLHGLVRADGLGDWTRALEEALAGPASQYLIEELSDIRKEFSQRLGEGTWQKDAVNNLHRVMVNIYDGTQPIPEKVALRNWFQMFAELRNKTRGHGAVTPATYANGLPNLNASLQLICKNNPIFHLPWAYLHRNLSGKYRVMPLGGDQEPFQKLKLSSAIDGENYANGVYFWAGKFRRVELIHTDLNVSDFLLPNGAFRKGTYELHSLITDNRHKGEAAPYMVAVGERPPSETEGIGELEVQGNVFTNLPKAPAGYVQRPLLESEVEEALTNDRHPIVTLVGRGGIGKTSVALKILYEIAQTNRYAVIAWFSARDIDLMLGGAKLVQPHLTTDREIAEEYRVLIGESGKDADGKKNAINIMSEHLRSSPLGPTLFVFDNFETVQNPIDLFQFIDMNIRLPNKAVITTRFRDFKADYPINVSGMEYKEAESLVWQTVSSLGIDDLISRRECDAIIEDSDGHPYVIKIMLGEIANAHSFSKPAKLIARREDVLNVLFERTFANLSPLAVRIFLVLSGWRSLVPQLAIEAALLRHGGESVDPALGIDQLIRMSLVERTSAGDGTDFLGVPLAAALFGKRKLEVDPSRTLIEDDIRFLQDIGATATSGLKDGLHPKMVSFFRKTARKISDGVVELENIRPVLHFLARGHSAAWLLLAELEEEVVDSPDVNQIADAIRHYLETQPPPEEAEDAWRRLVSIYRRMDDVIAGCSAFLRAAEINAPPLEEISEMANWLNMTSDFKAALEPTDREAFCKPLARLIEARLDDASATDLSRLAWLYLHCDDARRALEITELGLSRDSNNVYCQRLYTKIAQPAS